MTSFSFSLRQLDGARVREAGEFGFHPAEESEKSLSFRQEALAKLCKLG